MVLNKVPPFMKDKKTSKEITPIKLGEKSPVSVIKDYRYGLDGLVTDCGLIEKPYNIIIDSL